VSDLKEHSLEELLNVPVCPNCGSTVFEGGWHNDPTYCNRQCYLLELMKKTEFIAVKVNK
jgi:ribosomal protein S27AE